MRELIQQQKRKRNMTETKISQKKGEEMSKCEDDIKKKKNFPFITLFYTKTLRERRDFFFIITIICGSGQ